MKISSFILWEYAWNTQCSGTFDRSDKNNSSKDSQRKRERERQLLQSLCVCMYVCMYVYVCVSLTCRYTAISLHCTALSFVVCFIIICCHRLMLHTWRQVAFVLVNVAIPLPPSWVRVVPRQWPNERLYDSTHQWGKTKTTNRIHQM